MNVVARILDGPVAPLAIHFGAGVDEPPNELLFMHVPGARMEWVRLEPEFAATEDPDTRFEWYDLAGQEPYATLAGNALWPYTWREGYKTVILPPRLAHWGEALPDRLAALRAYIRERNPLEAELGDELQETMAVKCDRCGVVHKLNFDRMGTDWPEQLAGWGKTEEEGDLCPECVLAEATERG